MATTAEALRSQYAEKRTRLEFLGNPTDEAGVPRKATEAENTEFDGLEAECRGLMDRVHKLEALRLAPAPAPTEGPDRRNAPPIGPTAVHTRKHIYSINAAIRSALEGKALTGLEADVNAAIAERRGCSASGFYIPTGGNSEIRELCGFTESRTLNTTTGAGLIFNAPETPLIEYLRPNLVLEKVGARFLTDMKGLFSLPRQTGTSTPQAQTPGVNVTMSNPTFDQVAFSPKIVQSMIAIDPFLAYQTSFEAERLMKEDIGLSSATFFDYLGWLGQGGNQPTGLFARNDIPKIALGVDGGEPTWDTALALEGAVSIRNANRQNMAYVTNTDVRKKWKKQPKNGSGYPEFVWDSPTKAGADGEVNGYPAYCTNLIPNNYTKGAGTGLSGIAYGNFSDMVVAMWEGADLLVDKYTGREQNIVKVSIQYALDIQFRHLESFAIATDAKTS